jgi:hypothetical protein
MTGQLSRTVIEPTNPRLNVSRNANLPHSPGIRVGEYIFLSGMGRSTPLPAGATSGRSPIKFAKLCETWNICWHQPAPDWTGL